MNELSYDKDRTGLVVIDPYNDFISEGGKVWDRLKGVAEANDCVPHMRQVLTATRSPARIWPTASKTARRNSTAASSLTAIRGVTEWNSGGRSTFILRLPLAG